MCENKDTDQLRGNCEADQRLCFRYICTAAHFSPSRGLSHRKEIEWPINMQSLFFHDSFIKYKNNLKIKKKSNWSSMHDFSEMLCAKTHKNEYQKHKHE